MAKATINDLQSLIGKLQAERQAHLDAIAEIDGAFGRIGIQPGKRRGRPRGTTKTAKKAPKQTTQKKAHKRRKFKLSGSASILNFVKQAGRKGVKGSQINRHWDAEGRRSGCYNALGDLVKAKKVRRVSLKGQHGSLYIAG